MEYSEFVSKLCKPGELIRSSITAENAHMLHMAIGLSGEAGELLDAVKKHVIYEKELDVINVIEELGDLEFFLEGFRQSIGVNRQEIINNNIKKLSIRYSRIEYSNEAAQNRADKQ